MISCVPDRPPKVPEVIIAFTRSVAVGTQRAASFFLRPPQLVVVRWQFRLVRTGTDLICPAVATDDHMERMDVFYGALTDHNKPAMTLTT
jgi:hypothetical protein